MTRLLTWLFILIIVPGIFLWLLLSLNPIVDKKPPLSPTQAQQAKKALKQVWVELSSGSTEVDMSISESELSDLSAALNHTIGLSGVTINLSLTDMLAAVSYRLPLESINLYLNGYCLFTTEARQSQFEYCKLGRLTIPSMLIHWVFRGGLSLFFDKEVESSVTSWITRAKIEDQQLLLQGNKPSDFKERIKQSISERPRMPFQSSTEELVDTARVHFYIEQLASLPQKQTSLAFYIGEIFAVAKRASTSGNAIQENRAALWAIAISYGDLRFADLIGLKIKIILPYRPALTLQGRGDLVLHFLYSAILEQVGNVDISYNIGEFKELLDSSTGGSGYSFVDLAADKAGIAFSQRLAADALQARKVQRLLADSRDENVFFPEIGQLPEGLRNGEFEKVIGDIESEVYRQLEVEIDSRIQQLPLYREALEY